MLSAAGIVGLAVAALIGLAAGWLLARRGRDWAVAAAREVATAGTFQLADELYARTKRATELESKLGAVRAQVGVLKDAVAAADERAHVLEAEAESRAHAAGALEGERAGLGARVAELVAESAANAAAAVRRQQELDRLAALLGARDDEIASLRAQLKALEAATQAATRDQKPEAPGAPAVPPPPSRARRAARLPEDPRPAQQERSDDGNKQRDDLKLKRVRKEQRKKYGTGP